MQHRVTMFMTVMLLLTFSVQVSPETNSPTVLITGSNRGIGFAFAKQYAEKGWMVIATARAPE